MARQQIPSADLEFNVWLTNFNTALAAHYAAAGLTTNDVDALEIQRLVWDGKWTTHQAIQASAHTATAAKNTARKDTEAMLRSMIARILTYPGITPEIIEAFGLRPRGMSTSGLGLEHMDKPVPEIDRNEQLTHNVKVSTRTAEGILKKAKPAGVMGCEVRRAFGTPPESAEEMEVVGVMPGTSFAIKYPGEDVGKKVTYAMRWVPIKGAPGAWSDFQSATIAA